MSKTLFWLFACPLLLQAATLLNQNIYERPGSVDLMLSFDTPFQGTIAKQQLKETINITIGDISLNTGYSRPLDNPLVDAIQIVQVADDKALVKIGVKEENLRLEASRTVDGFGLRLRISSDGPPDGLTSAPEPIRAAVDSTADTGPKANRPVASWRYWSVMILLVLLLVAAWMIKKRGLPALDSSSNFGGWLMPSGTHKPVQPQVQILYQKPLDASNRIVLIEFNDLQYLMVIGSSNLLLDAYVDGKVRDQKRFDQVFEQNKKQLDHFLNSPDNPVYERFKANAAKEPSAGKPSKEA